MSGSYTITVPVYGVPARAAPPARRGGYDLAKTTDENRKHWAATDDLAPVSQLTPSVRRTLRNRARYEALNNGYMAGLVRTLVNDTVGRGPRLELRTDDSQLNATVEQMWREWAAATDLALTIRILAGVRFVAGECFAVYRDSKRLDRMGHPVTLDLRLIEPDQVTDGYGGTLFQATGDDGIVCDEDGEVIAYRILKRHPGDNRLGSVPFTPDEIRAENVVHWFIPDRPGQLRGAPPLAPTLPIFAQLRRFSSATLTAAEVAAMLAGVLKSNLPAESSPLDNSEMWFDTIDLVRGTLLTLPPGTEAVQFRPEQPTTNYQMFVEAKLRECGRALNVPFGKMAGDHSRYNYSSGRLDDAAYWADRECERQALEAKVFDPLLYKWLDLARFALPALAAFKGRPWELRHGWHYDARPTSDPVKDASGDELNLTNASDTLAGIAARDGTTVEALLDQRKQEMAMFTKRGLPLPPWLAGTTVSARDENGRPLTAKAPDQSAEPAKALDESADPVDAKDAARAAATGDVQATALNGAQIASLVAIGDKLVLNTYPADGAEAMIKAAFPLMDRELITEFVTKLSEYDAPAPAEPAQPAKSQEAPANA